MDEDIEALVRAAEASVANLQSDFEAENQRNVARLRDLWHTARENSGDGSGLQAVFRLSHDIKGQGTTFGYDLLSVIAASLCRLIAGPEAPAMSPRVAALIEAHVVAVELVTDRKITGSGGRQGEELVRQLRQASAAVRG